MKGTYTFSCRQCTACEAATHVEQMVGDSRRPRQKRVATTAQTSACGLRQPRTIYDMHTFF